MHFETHTRPIANRALLSVQFYLTVASLVTIAFGLLIAAAAWPPLAILMDPVAGILLGREGDFSARETRLLAAISGGTLTGWGMMILLVARRLLHRAPTIAGHVILVSIACWFAVDSLASLAATVPLNILGNLVFLVAFGLPAYRLVSAGPQTGDLAKS